MSSGDGRSGLFDALTRIDELIREQLNTVQSIHQEINNIGNNLNSLTNALSSLTGVEIDRGRKVQIEISTNVPANTSTSNPVTTDRAVPFSGRITEIVVGWPSGSDQRAGMQLALDNADESDETKLYPFNPEDDFVGLDDKTIKHDSGFDVDSGDKLIGKFANNDDTNSHFLNLIVTIEEDV